MVPREIRHDNPSHNSAQKDTPVVSLFAIGATLAVPAVSSSPLHSRADNNPDRWELSWSTAGCDIPTTGINFMPDASVAQPGRAAVELARKGSGSNPLCGTKSSDWPIVPGVYPSVNRGNFHGLPRCPKCGCTKRPHVVYSKYSRRIMSEGRNFTASCNYCKVRWLIGHGMSVTV